MMKCDENTKEVKFCIDMQKHVYQFNDLEIFIQNWSFSNFNVHTSLIRK